MLHYSSHLCFLYTTNLFLLDFLILLPLSPKTLTFFIILKGWSCRGDLASLEWAAALFSCCFPRLCLKDIVGYPLLHYISLPSPSSSSFIIPFLKILSSTHKLHSPFPPSFPLQRSQLVYSFALL